MSFMVGRAFPRGLLSAAETGWIDVESGGRDAF